MLRRSFHTLKGSGRMVGLSNFAEGGAAVERVMNAWLAEGRAASADLLALLDFAAADMAAWVDELATQRRLGAQQRRAGGGRRRGAGRRRVCDAGRSRSRRRRRTQEPESAPVMEQEYEPEADAEIIDMTLPDEPLGISEPNWNRSPEPELEAAERSRAGSPEPEPVAAATGGQLIEFPRAGSRNVPADDNTRRFGDLEIPLPLYNIYLAETDELMRVLTQDFGEWRHEPFRSVTPAALKAAHTLAGTSATVGFKALREVAYALEMALQALADPAPLLADAQRDLLDAALECARTMLQRFALGELPPAQPALVAQLVELREQFGARAPTPRTVLDDGVDAAPEAMPASEPQRADTAIEAVDHLFDAGFDDAFDEPMLLQAAPAPDDSLLPDEPRARARTDFRAGCRIRS